MSILPKSLAVGSTLVLAVLLVSGCSESQPISGDPPPVVDSHEGHDHSHAGHSHAHLGPNGGHLLELGDEQFHAEWVHDDGSGKITVYILDGNAKELVPIESEKLTIIKTVGERTDNYDLLAVDRQGEKSKTAKFEITDKALLAGLMMVGEGVTATLTVDIDGVPFTSKFTKHDDHHGHKH